MNNESPADVFDIEDVKFVIEEKISGKIVEHEGAVKFKMDPDSHIVKLDITDCAEIPVSFEFKKKVDAGCSPDKCIAENKRTCAGCKLENYSSMIIFSASLIYVKEENDRRIAIFHIK